MNNLVFCGDIYTQQRLPPLRFIWNITNYCNYACSYCLVEYRRTNNNIKENRINLDYFKIISKNFNLVNIPIVYEILGGEPTTHQDLPEMLQILKDEFKFFFTNISKSKEYFEKVFDSLDSTKIVFIVAIHLENHQTKKQIYSSISKIKLLNSLGFYTEVNIMAHPDFLELAKNVIEVFKKELTKNKNLSNVKLITLVLPTLKHPYSKEYMEFIKLHQIKNKFTILDENENIIKTEKDMQQVETMDWRGYKCFLNISKFAVKNELTSYPCGELTNSNEKFLILPKTAEKLKKIIYKPIICNHRYCNCEATIKIPKIHPDATDEQISKILPWYPKSRIN